MYHKIKNDTWGKLVKIVESQYRMKILLIALISAFLKV